MNGKESKLLLKPINDLLGESFYVPAYQRGFRWSDLQVNQLLSDIWEFRERMPKPKEGEEIPFYCLQPIVVKETAINDIKHWEVIDGQQRLTTILIILHYFNQKEFRNPKRIFSLSYQTRGNSADILNNIEDSTWADKNIDFFHMHKAYITIEQWFTNKDPINAAVRGDFYSSLINNVKIIWYEINDFSEPHDDSISIDIFTRLNIGKIPLTNSELIKALFLQSGNFQKEKVRLKQLQIASEWDSMEKTLQDNSFWYFIYNPSNTIKYDNHIEYIFDLMKNKGRDNETYYTFNEFQKDFLESKKEKDKPDIDAIWLKIKTYFLTFQEWFNNRELYHLIGFLIDCRRDINKLKIESEKRTKTSFKIYLKQEIGKEINYPIEELLYNDKRIKKILLLFNIQTIMVTKNAEMRFPFNRYKEELWDIEHVRSQTDRQISGNTRKDWAKDILEYFTGEKGYSNNTNNGCEKTEKEIQQEAVHELDDIEKDYAIRLMEMLDAEEIEDEVFNNLYMKLTSYFGEGDAPENIDSISNLTLLDSTTNRSYKNAMFPIKRKTIIENDMNGVFVPICTKNVFLKSYSKRMNEVMYWKEKDANDYLSALKQSLKEYLPIQ